MENENVLNKLSRRMLAADMKEVIAKVPFLNYSINSFLFGVKHQCAPDKKINFSFEIKEKISFLELGIIHSETAERIITELGNINRYSQEILRKISDASIPEIGFFSFGEGPFKGITIYKEGQYYCKV
ncbi:MAG: hypothetical protein K0S32_2902 [Bacteroidetes bacterium]|jgi:hypothetical protein|nr:hypothetical protein [Bacteroidota bacterium]